MERIKGGVCAKNIRKRLHKQTMTKTCRGGSKLGSKGGKANQTWRTKALAIARCDAQLEAALELNLSQGESRQLLFSCGRSTVKRRSDAIKEPVVCVRGRQCWCGAHIVHVLDGNFPPDFGIPVHTHKLQTNTHSLGRFDESLTEAPSVWASVHDWDDFR